MVVEVKPAAIDREHLRANVQAKYTEVAECPEQGFHFHTGRPLARLLGYPDAWLDALPSGAIESFAGTGNPFEFGSLQSGEQVLDIGSGTGLDSLIAARMVGPTGRIFGVDMTSAMLTKARRNAVQAGLTNVEFHQGFMAELPLPDVSVDLTVMFDSAEAFRHIDEIVGMPGIDAVTLGPSDLAQELGVLGTPDQARVIDEHRERLIAAAQRYGKDVAMLCQTLEEAERWIAAGVKIIAYASDVAILRAGFASAVARLRLRPCP